MAMKTDGPFKVGRQWYSQFYQSRDAATALTGDLRGIYHVPGMDTPADRQHAIDDGLPI
jgi:3-ketosteroid 9alpha-monooxygenase subunit A